MSSASTKHAQVIGKLVSTFLRGNFAVLSKFTGEVGLLVLSGGTRQVGIGPLVRWRQGGFVVGLFVGRGWCGVGWLVKLLFARLVIRLLGFPGNLRLTFPVAHIDLLDQLVHSRECWRFSDPGNFILDLIWKSLTELVLESRVTPGDLGCKVIEVNKIFHHPFIVLHPKSFELILHISFGVMWSKVVFELRGELGIIGDPIWYIITHESRFEPV